MNNGHVVAAFRVSGDAPSKGARITELLLIKLSDAGKEIERLMLPENAMLASTDGSLTPDVFSRLVEFVNDHPVVTHDGYNWKRFLRQEFASQSKDQVKHFLARLTDPEGIIDVLVVGGVVAGRVEAAEATPHISW